MNSSPMNGSVFRDTLWNFSILLQQHFPNVLDKMQNGSNANLYEFLLVCFDGLQEHFSKANAPWFNLHIVTTTEKDLVCTLFVQAADKCQTQVGCSMSANKSNNQYLSVHQTSVAICDNVRSLFCNLLNDSKGLTMLFLYADKLGKQTEYIYLVINSNMIEKDCSSISKFDIKENQLYQVLDWLVTESTKKKDIEQPSKAISKLQRTKDDQCKMSSNIFGLFAKVKPMININKKDIEQPSEAISSDIAQQAEAMVFKEGSCSMSEEEHTETPQSRVNGAKASKLHKGQETHCSTCQIF